MSYNPFRKEAHLISLGKKLIAMAISTLFCSLAIAASQSWTAVEDFSDQEEYEAVMIQYAFQAKWGVQVQGDTFTCPL